MKKAQKILAFCNDELPRAQTGLLPLSLQTGIQFFFGEQQPTESRHRLEDLNESVYRLHRGPTQVNGSFVGGQVW